MPRTDPAHEAAEERLAELERRIAREYGTALDDVRGQMAGFLARFERQDRAYRKRVEGGSATEAQYRAWRRDQVMDSDRFRALVRKLSEDLTRVAGSAMGIVNGELPGLYAEGMNYGTFEVERGTTVETAFTLYDRSTVTALIRDQPDLYPTAAVNKAKQEAWDRRHLTSVVTQGLLTGAPMDRIAASMERVVGMDAAQAARAARTCVTAAENSGRVDSYRRAERLGIKVRKQWLATLDGRTRSSHRELDGESVGVEEAFSNGLMYPGDPSGPGVERYNCRCTLVADLTDFPAEQVIRASKLGDMTYEQWKAEHVERTIAPPAPAGPFPHVAEALGQDYVDAMGTIMHFTEERDAAEMYERFGDRVRIGSSTSDRAYFLPSDGMVYMNSARVAEGDPGEHPLHAPYQTAFHEFAHAIDHSLGEGEGEAASTSWRDADGRSLRDVLKSDWMEYKAGYLRRAVSDDDLSKFEALVGFSPRLMVEQVMRADVGVADERTGERWGNVARRFKGAEHGDIIRDPDFKRYVLEEYLPGNVAAVDSRAVITYMRRDLDGDVGRGACVSDALEGLTGRDYPLGSGHGRDYHLNENKTMVEFFAEVCDGKMCNPSALAYARGVFPNGVAAVEGMIREALDG